MHKINEYGLASQFEMFHKLEFDMSTFITQIFKVQFVGNIHEQICNTALY